MYLKTPYVLAVDESPAKNLLQQVAAPTAELDGTLTPFTADKVQGWLFQPTASAETILIVPPKTKLAKVPNNHARIIAADIAAGPPPLVDVTGGTWLRHPQLGDGQATNRGTRRDSRSPPPSARRARRYQRVRSLSPAEVSGRARLRTSSSRTPLAMRAKTEPHVIHTRPFDRCVSINVYREKEMVAGAGFERIWRLATLDRIVPMEQAVCSREGTGKFMASNMAWRPIQHPPMVGMLPQFSIRSA
jgi:hypothetical protein